MKNLQRIEAQLKHRNINLDFAKYSQLRNELKSQEFTLNQLRKQRNLITKEERSLGLEIKQRLHQENDKYRKLLEEFKELDKHIPNDSHPSVPKGDFKVIYQPDSLPKFDFEPLDHLTLCQRLKMVDIERAGKVSQTRSYFLKNDGALLELALTRYAMDIAISRGFTPVITPDIIKRSILDQCGFSPRSNDPQTYFLSTRLDTHDDKDLCLAATAEFPLAGMYSKETLDERNLPIKMVGQGHAFRAEGLSGKTNKGLYRVHQFTKVELFALTRIQDSMQMFFEFIDIQKEIFDGIGLCYRILNMPEEELGAPAYIKYDIEAYMPGRNEWGEISSTSNCTDFQSRKLGIKTLYKNQSEYVATINGTACAVPRLLIALIETHQQVDGSIKVPEKLIPYLNKSLLETN